MLSASVLGVSLSTPFPRLLQDQKGCPNLSLTTFLMSAATPPLLYLPGQVGRWGNSLLCEFPKHLTLFYHLRMSLWTHAKVKARLIPKNMFQWLWPIFFFIDSQRQISFLSPFECVSCRNLKGSLCRTF